MAENTDQVNLRLDKEVIETLKQLSDATGITYTELIRRCINNYVNDNLEKKQSRIELKTKFNYNPIYDKLLVTLDFPKLTDDNRIEVFIDDVLMKIPYQELDYGNEYDSNIIRDKYVFDLLENNVKTENTICWTYWTLKKNSEALELEARGLDPYVVTTSSDKSTSEHISTLISLGFAMLETNNLYSCKIICHPYQYRYIRQHPEYDSVCQRDIIMSALYGHVEHADVHVSCHVPKDTIYILPPAETLGFIHFDKNKVASKIIDNNRIVKIKNYDPI